MILSTGRRSVFDYGQGVARRPHPRTGLSLVAGEIAAAIGSADAYEEERRRGEAPAELHLESRNPQLFVEGNGRMLADEAGHSRNVARG